MTHSSLMATAMLIASSVPTLSGAQTFTYGNFDPDSGTCAITAYDGTDTEILTIPDFYSHENKTYNVTRVEADVFHGLPSLTTVNIGHNLATIGDTKYSLGATLNFYDCPQLTRFVVRASNPCFSATRDGILTDKDGTTILLVPSHVATNDGLLQLPASTMHIGTEAFRGVNTVSTLHLNAALFLINWNGGLNAAPSLCKFTVDPGNSCFHVTSSGLLVEFRSTAQKDQVSIISLPPKSGTVTLSIPNSVVIGDTEYPVTAVEEKAMSNHPTLTSVIVPVTVEKLLDEAFARCPSLSKLTIHGTDVRLSEGLARDCPLLEEVAMTKAPGYVELAAFKNCHSLKKFPFHASTQFQGDSIFYDTGFDKVVFEAGEWQSFFDRGHGMFANCRNLRLIDFSAVTLPLPPAKRRKVDFPEGFATGCPQLATIIFPPESRLLEGAFEGTPSLLKIVIQNFVNSNGNLLTYPTPASPELYAVTRNTYPRVKMPISNLFSKDSPELSPTIYCDAWTLHVHAYDSETGEPTDSWYYNPYYIPNATYYLPGGALGNYDAAPAASRHEMYSIHISPTYNNGTRIACRPLVDGVVMDDAEVGYSKVSFPDDGVIETTAPFSTLSEIKVSYTVNGVKMGTTYPSEALSGLSETDAISIDTSLAVTVAGRTAKLSHIATWNVTDMHGRVMASGHGSEADLSALHAGFYIINAHTADTSITTKIRLYGI